MLTAPTDANCASAPVVMGKSTDPNPVTNAERVSPGVAGWALLTGVRSACVITPGPEPEPFHVKIPGAPSATPTGKAAERVDPPELIRSISMEAL